MGQDYTYQQSMGGKSYSPVNPASTLRRIGAYIIDIILIGIVQGIIIGVLYFMGFFSFQMFLQPGSPTDFSSVFSGFQLGLTTLSAVIQLGYFTVMESEKFSGATLGKRLLSIKVVGENGGEVDMGPSFIRNLARLLWSLPCVGFIILIVDVVLIADGDQRIGDKIANTYVVKQTLSGQAYSQTQDDYSGYGGGKGQQPRKSGKTPPPPKPPEETESKGYPKESETSRSSRSRSSEPWEKETEELERPSEEQKKRCPECGKNTLVVSSGGSEYCTNCDYTKWE